MKKQLESLESFGLQLSRDEMKMLNGGIMADDKTCPTFDYGGTYVTPTPDTWMSSDNVPCVEV